MSQRQTSSWAIGWTFFAAFMMILMGSFHIVAGLAGILKDNFYLISQNGNYAFKFDATAWGWIHLVLGVIVLLAGFGLYKGSIWARTVGVIIALIAGFISFVWLPVYPIWAIILITISVAIIWSLTAHGRDITETM
ncbi:MAG: hypothetical protein ACM3OO_05130 [Planctomycetaceae bacterium]